MSNAEIVGNEDLACAIERVNPYAVAVAYIGADYHAYIDVKTVKDFVVSPTLGSNPQAIRSLVKAKTWKHVHFLDRLHAKIYLGAKTALLASANLTKNGLDIAGLREVGVVLQGKPREALVAEFASILAEAKKTYPKQQDKEKALIRLEATWKKVQKALRNGAKKPRTRATFDRYDIKSHGAFHPVWWDSHGEIDEATVRRELNLGVRAGVDLWRDSMFLTPKDKVMPGQWILQWCVGTSWVSRRKVTAISWQFVDYICHNCTDEPDYPNAALELEPDFRPQLGEARPSEPFQIDAAFRAAFKKVIVRETFKTLQPPDDDNETWYIENDQRLFKKLITAIRVEYPKVKKALGKKAV